MTVQDGFFWGVGFFGSLLTFVILLVLITVVTAFVSYLLDYGGKRSKRKKTGKDDEHKFPQ